MAVTAALIAGGAGLASAGIGAYAASRGSPGPAQRIDYTAAQLAQARQDAVNAALRAADTRRLGLAGYSDNQGSSYQYDPATNSWVSTIGPQPLTAQIAAQNASIRRNTTDLRTAEAANEQSRQAASRAQPLIDAAQRRLAQFKPMSGNELSSLLGETAANANTTAYRPLIQDTLRTFARTGSAAGPVLADIGRRSAADLRQGMIDARLKGIAGATDISNSQRQGLTSDLATATASGTPSFNFPGVQPDTSGKDMLTALANRATGSAYTSALGSSGVNQANAERGAATNALVSQIPTTDPSLVGLVSGARQISDFAQSPQLKSLIDLISKQGNTPVNYNLDKNPSFGSSAADNPSIF